MILALDPDTASVRPPDSPRGGAGDPFAQLLDANPLDPAFALPADPPTLVIWSGSPNLDDPFARDPRAWLPAGLEQLDTALDKLLLETRPSSGASGRRLLLRPHARHVLCDATRTRSLFESRADDRPALGLFLDPVALLEPEMLDLAPDHLARTLELLAPLADAVLLCGAQPGPRDTLAATPIHRGSIPARALAEVARLIPPSTPIVLLGEDLPAQVEHLDPARYTR